MLTGHAASARRAGFTLIELVIAMVLMSLVGGAIVKVLLQQQRFYNSTTDLIQTRQQIRQATAMLPSDLRGIASGDSDIYVMTDSSLEFRSVFGSSIACSVDAGGGWVSTVPQVLAKGSAMTSWTALPSVGDSIAVYDEGTITAQSDDRWSRAQITAVTLRTGNVNDGCPTASGLAQLAGLTASNPSYKLTITPKFPNVTVGASIRFLRRVHYNVYKASDNQWYLGYYDCKTGRVPVCNAVQPIAGPFQPYAVNGSSGVQFAYYDSTGAVTTKPSEVARISLVVRGQSAGLLNLSGAGGTVFRDSLRIEVGLRNRK
jgi:prepilin-type N-terminal cleavage/methylation domain-containing protein